MKTHFSTENSLVFVVVCSLVCFGSTKKDETKGVSRTYVTEGEDAVLHCSSGESLVKTVIDWKNKDKEVFLYSYGEHYENGRPGQDDQYKGRVSLFYDELKNGNASMILRNTRIEDAGIYTCILPHVSFGREIPAMELIVGVSRTYVKEGEDVVLHCSAGGNLENTVIQWKNTNGKKVFLYSYGQHSESGRSSQDDQYKGRVSLFYKELKNGNASMILRNTRIEDTGIYTCVLLLFSSGSKIWMKLIVEPVYKNRFGLEKGAAQAPYVGVYKASEDSVELQCEVRGSSSKPSVEWETCEGISLKATNQTVSETRGRYDTTRFVTVTKTETNCFNCVVKQEDIYHRVHQEITLSEKLFEKKSCNCTGELVFMWLTGGVIVVSLLALLLYLIKTRRSVRGWMMGKMKHMIKSMEEMEHRSTYKTPDQNTGNGGENDEMNLLRKSSNKTSGETDGVVKRKIPQTGDLPPT